jgi:4'-phosphopantetheinyl transferase
MFYTEICYLFINMPLLIDTTDINPGKRLLVWDSQETTEELVAIAHLNEQEMAKLSFIQLEKRKREWLDTRILLKTYHNDKTIAYLENGKPVFTDGTHLSISHCADLVGIITADESIGMDIQNPDKKLLLIQKKFCNGQELQYIPSGEAGLVHTTIIWSAKEAIFKVFGENVPFADDMTIRPFAVEDAIIHADYDGVYGQRHFALTHLMHGEYHILIAQ